MNLILRQATVIAGVYFLVINLPVAIIFQPILKNLGIEKSIADSASLLVLYLLPGLFFRSLNESSKGMLQSMGYIKNLGVCSFINILLMIPIAYLFIGVLHLKELGYGISLAIY